MPSMQFMAHRVEAKQIEPQMDLHARFTENSQASSILPGVGSRSYQFEIIAARGRRCHSSVYA